MLTPPLAASTPFYSSNDFSEPVTPGTSFYLPPTVLEADQTSATRIECESVTTPKEHLNTFLKTREILSGQVHSENILGRG